jgi:hypothetical protein
MPTSFKQGHILNLNLYGKSDVQTSSSDLNVSIVSLGILCH